MCGSTADYADKPYTFWDWITIGKYRSPTLSSLLDAYYNKIFITDGPFCRISSNIVMTIKAAGIEWEYHRAY